MDKEIADKTIVDYMGKIYGFALSKTNDIDLAEELAARITFEAYKSLIKAENINNIDGYIYKIARNVHARFVAEEMSGNHFANIEMIPPSKSDHKRDETLDRIREEVVYLSEIQRNILIMYYYDNMQLNEIAEQLDLPLGTVGWHISEARNQIKNGFDERKRIEINQKQTIFTKIYFYNQMESSDMIIDHYFSKSLTQNIAYSAYHKPKTSVEIAKELAVPTPFVENIISKLTEQGFMRKLYNNKFITDIYIIEPSKERDEKVNKTLSKYAVLVCEKYIPLLFDVGDAFMRPVVSQAQSTLNSNIYVPQNDLNFLMWSIVTYACWKKLAIVDKNDDLLSLMKKLKDEEKQITVAQCTDIFMLSDNNDITRKSIIYPIKAWKYFSKFNGSPEKSTDWRNIHFEILYRFITGNLKKDTSNINLFKMLFDKGLIVSQKQHYKKYGGVFMLSDSSKDPTYDCSGLLHKPLSGREQGRENVKQDTTEYANTLITSFTETEFIDLLPNIPDDLRNIGQEFDDEMFWINKDYFPSHKKDLCRVLNKNSLTSGAIRSLILEHLLKNRILKPLKKHQKNTVNTIMFCDVLPS